MVPAGGNACITEGTAATPVTVTLDAPESVNKLQIGANNTVDFNLGEQLTVLGVQIINSGQIIDTGVLAPQASATLSGGGTVTLSGGAIEGGAVTLTNVDNTIQGSGLIGGTPGTIGLVNEGVVDANAPDLDLTLNGGNGVINTNVLTATNGGTLEINTTVNNAGGTILGGGGTVVISNGDVQGGTLTTTPGGAIESGTSATLDGSTNGPITISTGSTYTAPVGTTTTILGTFNNNGNIQITSGPGLQSSNVVLSGNVILQGLGGGTVTLIQTGGGGPGFYAGATGVTLTNVTNTIQGAGSIGEYANGLGSFGTINEAVIDANASGQTLTLNGSVGVTNLNLLEATNTGTLVLNTTVDNAGARFWGTAARCR